MPNLTARQMLSRIPVRMAEGGEARAFSDDEVKQFIQSTYAQFGGPGVEAHKAIADAMAQYGVGVNQVARVTGFSPREVEAEFMGQRAGERPALDDPTGSAAGMSAAYRAAATAGGQQTVDDYYANLRKDAEAYLANANAPTGVDAYNTLIQSGISTSDLRAAGVADAVLDKIFTVQAPIAQEQFVTPAGMTSAYERSPDLAFESQRLGQEGRAILDKQGRDYIANLQQGGIDAAERAQMLEYATERGYSFQDLIGAGVDPNVLFTQRAAAGTGTVGGGTVGGGTVGGGTVGGGTVGGGTVGGDTVGGDTGTVDDGSEAAAEAERQRLAAIAAAEAERQRLAAIAAAEAERQRLAAIAAAEAERQRQAAAKAAADKAAADKAAADAERQRLLDIKIAEEAERVRQAAAKAAADKAAADAAADAERRRQGERKSCPSPEMQILLADGTLKKAEDLQLGDKVKTQHETTLEWGDYEVTHVSVIPNTPRLMFKFDGLDFVCSHSHKFFTEDGKWVDADAVAVGDRLSGKTVLAVVEHSDGPVVRITVADAHTYICEGLFSHNKSPDGPTTPLPPPVVLTGGVTPDDLVTAVTPTGPTAAELQAAIDAANAKAAKDAADAKAAREAAEAAERARIAGLTKDAVTAVTPSYNAKQLQDIIKAAEGVKAAEGTVTNPLDTRGSAATGSQSGVTTFLDTYEAPKPFVAPAYTAPTVYGQLPTQPDIYAAGQAALDTTFNQSPRTAILDDKGRPTGQFDYSPAAKLRPATGAGFTFTPPSVTTRPRSLLSPREVQAYGGLGPSKSQQFAQNRAAIDRNLRAMLGSSPALRNTSTYNMLRNRVMSGEFGDAQRAFDPQTPEGQRFQTFLASLESSAPTGQAAATGTVATGTGTVADSTQAGGYAAAIEPVSLNYGGYRMEEFAKGGYVKKSEGSAQDELARFAEGGPVDADLLRRQLEGIDNTPTARTPEQATDAAVTESRSMLDRLKQAGSFLNQGFYEQVAKPAVGTAVDMTLGLGDLVQMGARYLGNRAGMDAGEFTSVAQPAKEALGVEDYNPYSVGGLGASILPFATAGRAAAATTRAVPGAMLSPTGSPSAARQLSSMFPNLGRETGAYVAGETGAAAARGIAPDSALAEVAGAALGSTGASMAMGSPTTARAQMAEITQRAPTVENPFVGRLDAFVSGLQGRTTLPNLVNQIQGKLRDYDVARVKRIMRDVPADTKFTSAEILEKLQANYNPANFRVTQITNVPNFYESMDNPWSNDSVQPRHSTIVLSVNDLGGGGSPEAAKDARDGLLRLDSDYRIMRDSDPTDYYGFAEYYKPLVKTLTQDSSDLSRTALATLGRIEDRIRTTAENVDVMAGFEARMRQEAIGPTYFDTHKNRLLEQGGVPAAEVLSRAYANAFQQRYDQFVTRLRSRLPEIQRLNELPVFKAEDYQGVPADRINEAVEVFLGRNVNPLLQSVIREQKLDSGAYISEQEAMLSGNQELRDFLTERAQSARFAPGSNPTYLGQHPSVTGKVKNHVSFSRASDVTANIPEIGPDARGIYVHELQSDLLDDMRTTGGPRSLTTEELIKRRPELENSIEALDQRANDNVVRINQLKKEYRDRALSVEQRYRMEQIPMTEEEVVAQRKALEAVEAIEQENYRLYQRRSGINIGLENLDRRVRGDDVLTQGVMVDEAFAGMDTNPKALQQLMIKAAVKAAVDRGHDFVALTSPLHSAQPQLYERVPQNARDVVKDLGEGFQVRQVELQSGKGPFTTTAIVWGRDASGREGVNRLLTQGVPFKDGGEVSSAKLMLDRLTFAR